jgi:hypothetical protein
MRERVVRLRERLFGVNDRTVFWGRVLASRQAYQEHGHERPTRLYALAMREISETMSVVIGEDDLVVGDPREILLSLEEETRFAEYYDDYFQRRWFHTRGHLTPAWDLVLERGLLDLRGEAEARAAALSPADPDAAQRREFWEAVTLCSGSDGTQHLGALIETYVSLGGQDLQINLVSAETLRSAQQDAEQYRGLVVRVTGYSAYFVSLDRQSQDLLITAADH